MLLLRLVLLGMLGDVLKGPLDHGRYRGRGRQMGALRLESVLVRHVRDLVEVAVVAGETVAARGLEGLLIGALSIEVALLLNLDPVAGLVAVAVGAVGVGPVQRLLENGNRGSVGRGGRRRCHEGEQDDYLRGKREMRLFRRRVARVPRI